MVNLSDRKLRPNKTPLVWARICEAGVPVDRFSGFLLEAPNCPPMKIS